MDIRDDESIVGQVSDPPRYAEVTVPASLLGTDPVELRERWRDLQSTFVDAPREAVQQAGSMLDEVMASMRGALEDHTHELQDRWKNAGQGDTEQLRTILRSYRDVLHRLLSLDESPR
ncbi:hypothetical protein ACIBG8_02425 [Nonomuraea sp. NPDC050556]|uniref:hypothetical protein n=1 Tax=Nonomuraea sp. NPDC050556 TaxID=3364369 RepID=UPI00378AAA8D